MNLFFLLFSLEETEVRLVYGREGLRALILMESGGVWLQLRESNRK